MRKLWIAAATVLAGFSLATPAAAQRVWQNGRWVVMPHGQSRPQMQPRANRWGPVVNGRWDAGNRAPGGWSAYRRPVRGWTLPGYWRDSRFRVPDYLSFGLSAPPRGYYWVRYYDDAVLVDDGGNVWDSMAGIGWGASAEASYDSDYSYAESGASVATAGAGYPPPPRRPIENVDPNAYYRESGAYLTPEPDYDAEPIPALPPSYPAGGYAPPVVQGPPAVQVQTVPARCAPACPGYGVQSGSYGATTYYGGGYGATTVVVIPAVATTTTTTTETYTTSYVSVAKRAVRRAPVRKWRPKPKCCVCVCR